MNCELNHQAKSIGLQTHENISHTVLRESRGRAHDQSLRAVFGIVLIDVSHGDTVTHIIAVIILAVFHSGVPVPEPRYSACQLTLK